MADTYDPKIFIRGHVEADHTLFALTGHYNISGNDANVTMSSTINVESSDGSAALLLSGDMQSGSDKLLLSGDMQSGSDVLLLTSSDIYNIEGHSVELEIEDAALRPEAGEYEVDGGDASLFMDAVIEVQNVSYSASGNSVSLLSDMALISETGGITITGNPVEFIIGSDANKLLLSGDMQSGSDGLLLSGDMQSGSDVLLLSGDN